MTKEEKAKKYDEALNWMRELYPGLHGATKEDAEHYFPELKESEDSEDERIRKFLLRLAKRCSENSIDFSGDIKKKDVIAWLEKQKEQKPSINIDQLKSLMLQYLQEAANEKDDSDIEADTDKWARKILGYDFEQKLLEWSEDIIRKGIKEVGLTQYQIKWLKNNVFPPKKEQKPETKITGWVARDRNGEICIYEDYPERISAQQFWFGQGSNRILDQKSFPDLKWEDEPVEVEATIRRK